MRITKSELLRLIIESIPWDIVRRERERRIDRIRRRPLRIPLRKPHRRPPPRIEDEPPDRGIVTIDDLLDGDEDEGWTPMEE